MLNLNKKNPKIKRLENPKKIWENSALTVQKLFSKIEANKFEQ